MNIFFGIIIREKSAPLIRGRDFDLTTESIQMSHE